MEEIHDYLRGKELKIKKEKLKAWINYYKECNNDWLAQRAERQLKRL